MARRTLSKQKLGGTFRVQRAQAASRGVVQRLLARVRHDLGEGSAALASCGRCPGCVRLASVPCETPSGLRQPGSRSVRAGVRDMAGRLRAMAAGAGTVSAGVSEGARRPPDVCGQGIGPCAPVSGLCQSRFGPVQTRYRSVRAGVSECARRGIGVCKAGYRSVRDDLWTCAGRPAGR